MAIRMMVGKDREGLPGVERVDGYPGWDVSTLGPLLMETTHVGLVLSTGEYNGYDDSDFFAEVWDPEKGEPKRIIYASTRGWTYPNGAAVDATPEVRAAYATWVEARHEAARKARAEAERKAVRVGKDVRVVRGRKVPIGTVGRVTWMGDGKWGTRVAIMEPNATRHFTAASNVEVVEEAA